MPRLWDEVFKTVGWNNVISIVWPGRPGLVVWSIDNCEVVQNGVYHDEDYTKPVLDKVV